MLSPSLTSTTALLAALALATRATVAVAETEPTSPFARLEVQSTEGCTSRAELAAGVIRRSPRIRFVDEGGELTVRAQFYLQPSGDVASEVLFTKPNGSFSTRRLVARNCAEATNAVALIVAVTIDPNAVPATPDASPDAPPASPETSSSQPSVTTGEEKPAATTAANPARPVPSDGPARPDAASEDMPSDARSVAAKLRFGAYLSAQALLGPAPKAMPAVAVHALIGLDRSALWSPALIVGFSHTFGTTVSTGVDTSRARAVFTLDAASLEACPFRFELPGFEARSCALGLLGRLSAEGRSTFNSPGGIMRPFAVVGGSAVLTVGLGSWVELLGRVGVGGNLVQDSFVFTPVTFHTVGAVTVGGSVGVGIRAP
jgi:hypothetical protein